MTKAATAAVSQEANVPNAQGTLGQEHVHDFQPMFKVLDRDSSGYIVAWYPVLVCSCWDVKAGSVTVLTDEERKALGSGAGWIA